MTTSNNIPVSDGHNDTLLRCYYPGKDENRLPELAAHSRPDVA